MQKLTEKPIPQSQPALSADRSYKQIASAYLRAMGPDTYRQIVTAKNPNAPLFSVQEVAPFRLFANCYDYAVNDLDYVGTWSSPRQHIPKNHTPFPWGDQHVFDMYVADVKHGLKIDGLHFVEPSQFADLKASQNGSLQQSYLVAAYVKPCDLKKPLGYKNAFNIHFVRQDGDGRWSHKNGTKGEFSRIDMAGKPIIDPIQADMGTYQFIGFYAVPKQGLDVGDGPRYNIGGVQLTPEDRRELDRLSIPAARKADPMSQKAFKKLSYAPASTQDLSELTPSVSQWVVDSFKDQNLTVR